MRRMKEEGLPLRPHYFWPLFIHYQKDKNIPGEVLSFQPYSLITLICTVIIVHAATTYFHYMIHFLQARIVQDLELSIWNELDCEKLE